MNYIKINDDGSHIFPYDVQNLRNELTNILLPLDIPVDILEANSIYTVTYLPEPSHNKDTHYTVRHENPVYKDNQWSIGYNIVEYLLPEKEEKIRSKRDNLLSETDWTQLSDIPYNTKITWQTYRQALRDITIQEGFPDNVVWPTKPE